MQHPPGPVLVLDAGIDRNEPDDAPVEPLVTTPEVEEVLHVAPDEDGEVAAADGDLLSDGDAADDLVGAHESRLGGRDHLVVDVPVAVVLR